MKSLILCFASCLIVFGETEYLKAEVLFSYNEDSEDFATGTLWPYSIGWLWEAPYDFYLTGFETKFRLGSPSRRLTVSVYDDLPHSGGTLLASSEYDQVGNVWGGVEFAPIRMIAGEDYLFGLWDVAGLKNNFTRAGGEAFSVDGRVHYDSDGSPPPSFVESYVGQNTAVVHIHGTQVPEPSTLVLLCIGAVGFIAHSRRRRR